VSPLREGELYTIEEEEKPLFGLFPQTRILVLNSRYFCDLLAFAGKDRELAAYLLVKLLLMKDGIDPVIDSKLISLSLKRRGLRGW